MKKFTSKILLVAFVLVSFNMFSFNLGSTMLFSAKMDGASETPSVSGTGKGIATFLLNSNRDTLCINLTFTGLTGSPTGIHIHNGAVGVNGGVAIDLTSYITGNRLAATITGTVLSTLLKANMLRGLTYINIHTAANPGGEIRGQISLESDLFYGGSLDGNQVVPSITTNASGNSLFVVSKHLGSVKFYVVLDSLSGPITSAHLHTGATGTNGGVAQDLSSFISGNTITGVFTPSAGVITSMMAGNIYLNIHTAANPGGEIRAQLSTSNNYVPFVAWMNGAQSTPSVATSAKGLVSVVLNATMDTLVCSVLTTGLSGTITSAHLHNGAVGVAGGVALAFTVSGPNSASGMATGAAVTTALVNNLLKGLTYVNVHTAANPGGEIRGQVYRVMREGYTFQMNGYSQSPSITSAAAGSGMVSINNDYNNAHYMLQTNGVVGFSSIHFHKGAFGTNGGVINDITSVYATGGAYGYWKSTDATPFTLTNANTFDMDSAYVNLHTTGNPSGEIRGQVYSEFSCFIANVGVPILTGITSNGVSIYPNPSTNNFNISFGTETSENVNITMYDMIGKLVQNSSFTSHVGENIIRLDIKNSPTGMYFVKVSNGKQEVIKKLIVE